MDEAANRVRQEVDPDANIIVGATFDETLGDKVRVSIVASGMSRSHAQQPAAEVAPVWTPQPSSPPAPPAEATSDFHRRLSAAIDEGAERDAGIEDIVVPEAHRAPGEVYIQEGPPQLSPLPPATWGKNRATNAEPGAADPRGAADLFRAWKISHRMPSVSIGPNQARTSRARPRLSRRSCTSGSPRRRRPRPACCAG